MQQFPTSAPPETSSGSSRIVRRAEVRERLGVGSSTLSAMVAAGKFPKPFPIFSGGRAVGWREDQIEAWLQQRSGNGGENAYAARQRRPCPRLLLAHSDYGARLGRHGAGRAVAGRMWH